MTSTVYFFFPGYVNHNPTDWFVSRRPDGKLVANATLHGYFFPNRARSEIRRDSGYDPKAASFAFCAPIRPHRTMQGVSFMYYITAPEHPRHPYGIRGGVRKCAHTTLQDSR